ncbi:MAG TPA: hypothetical protein VJJ82_03030 [Candidatus Nanoarchaeia archaeon]|nr:hypothetical protein [Candidatus Nanoarchaeia archaeon]
MKSLFALGMLVLLISCAQQASVQIINTTIPIKNAEPVDNNYTVFPCSLVNGNWTFKLQYPDVTIERDFKAEDACRQEQEAFTTTTREVLEHCYAANLSDDCLTYTAVKTNDTSWCLQSDSEKLENCRKQVEETQ